MIHEKIVKLGEHMHMSSRRIVGFCGAWAKADTRLGLIEGVADGAILIDATRVSGRLELTPAEAREIAHALNHAAMAVEEWQRKARGYYRVLAERTEAGVLVTYNGRTRPMRLSTLRGRKDRTGKTYYRRSCTHCGERTPQLWVAADDLRERESVGGYRVEHAVVCPTCIERLTSEPAPIAGVTQFPGSADRREP